MKLYISSDIEGTCGITHWDETDLVRGGIWYDYFRAQMTREVKAACEGALESGVSEIRVKDAHDYARNLNPAELPLGVCISRGWSGSYFSMVAGLEDGFDALAFTGYHSPAHGDGNPLAHTMNTTIDEVTINGLRTSEFIIFSYAAGLLGVPVIFLSGDAALCEQAKAFVPGITTVATSEGRGNASISLHPDEAVKRIREGMSTAVSLGGKDCTIVMPPRFDVTVSYSTHPKALRNSQYPGAKRLDEKTIGFTAEDYRDVLRFFAFCL